LLTLPGIGPYTAAAISAIAYDLPETVVDGNVERVMARMFAVSAPLPGAKAALTTLAGSLTPTDRPGDYAQAVMDLGATICTPRKPACAICPWVHSCMAREQGIAASLPCKMPKIATPTREGTVWIARRADGAMLLERRADKGLLGGMLGWPGSDWDGGGGDAPLAAAWDRAGEVRHTFTHFHLVLTVMVAEVAPDARARRGAFHPHSDFRPADLPTVMRKAYDLASGAFSSR
jgi:A/G-specific adenine glycosylase